MNHNPPIATLIEVVFVAAFIWGLVVWIKPFFFPKNKERETIHKSARNQQNLIGRRVKK